MMNLPEEPMQKRATVAELNYLANLDEIPVFAQSDRIGESIRVNDNRAPRDVPIINARLLPDILARCGRFHSFRADHEGD